MRWIGQSPNALEKFGRVIVLFAAVSILSVTVAMPGWSQSSVWQVGEYRDFTPWTPPSSAGSGVTVRSLGPVLKLEQTAVQRPKLNPGEQASLRAQYSVVAAGAGPVDVKETRIIRFEDAVLTTLTRVVSRSNGPVGSEYRLKIPDSAAEGWYTVTTTVEPAGPTTRSIGGEQAKTTFLVEPATATPPTPAPPAAPQPDADGTKIKLWAGKTLYRVGESVTLSFETNKDAYVTLVNVGTSGALTILFPNRFSVGHAVKGQTQYTIPGPNDGYELNLNGPPGVELVYALVTLKPVQFVETDFSQTREVFPSLARGVEAVMRDINVVAKKTPLKEQAKAVLELEVAP